MLRLVLCGAIAATALLAAPANFSSAEAKVYNLKYADIGPPRGPRAKALMWWAKELESRSNGNIKIKWYWSQSLVKGKATMKAVGSRIADVGTVIGIYHPAEFPVWNYANTPFLHSDAWVGMRTWYELRQIVPEIKAETDKHKITMIANNTTGPVQLLMAKKPVTTVAGLKGMKIRTSGGWTHLFKALGAVPVKIGFGELYAALDRGTIDGTINYTPFVKSYKHYEVACCLTEAAMGQVLGYGIGMNTKLLNSMPADIRGVVVKTSVEYMDVYARNYIGDMAEAQVALQAGIDGRKVKILKLSKAEEAKFRAAAATFTSDWKKKITKKGMDPDAILAKIKMVHAKWTKRLKEKGYPWAPK